jgi:hypothetical protein
MNWKSLAVRGFVKSGNEKRFYRNNIKSKNFIPVLSGSGQQCTGLEWTKLSFGI